MRRAPTNSPPPRARPCLPALLLSPRNHIENMAAVADESANSLAKASAGAAPGVPNDGTGTSRLSLPASCRQHFLAAFETHSVPPGVLQLDPWLEPFQDALKRRYAKAQDWIKRINEVEGGLEKFSRVRVLSPSSCCRWMLTLVLLPPGCREIRPECRQGQQHCLPRMGAQRRRGLAFRRFQFVPVLTRASNGTGIAFANVVPFR